MTDTQNRTAPSDGQVVHALARRFYLDYCHRKGWDPHPFPYCDAASIRYAEIAVGHLGYEDDVDVSIA